MTRPELTVRGLTTRAVRVPMRRPLGTSATRMTEAPLVLLDLETEEGVSGRAYAFCYMELAAPMVRRVLARALEAVRGDRLAPPAIAAKLRDAFTLLGTQGVVGMALAALDVACWDALARAAGVPLARFLGGEATIVPAYNSNGLGLTDPAALGAEAAALLAEGFDAVKIRLGRAEAARDLEAIRLVRAEIPSEAVLMADYNQALSPAEAVRRGRALDEENLCWIEEPVRHDDLAGSARVAREVRTPVQIGENFCGPNVMASAIAAGACDYVMPDPMRIGGVTGWLRAAELAERAGMPMSSHLYPEVSVHLLAATPTRHWLEYVDWAEPVLAEPVAISDGAAAIADRPGNGIEWNEAVVRKFLAD